MKTQVVNRRFDSYDVYIGRPTKWGNPFRIGQDGTREQVIARYEKMARETYSTADLAELRGKRLGCWCKPEACHGDVLVQLVKEVFG